MSISKFNTVVIQLTEKCDKQCLHCYQNATMSGKSMDFSLFCNIAQMINNYNKEKYYSKKYISNIEVTLSGGEVFLYESENKNIIDIIDYLNRNAFFFNFGLLTGGIKKEYDHLLDKMKNLSFGISYNLFKNIKYSNTLFINSIEKISKQNRIRSINIAYLPPNVDNEKHYNETTHYFNIISESYPFLKEVIISKGAIRFTGRAELIKKKYNFNDLYTNNCKKRNHEIVILYDGTIEPCASCIPKEEFKLVGWSNPKVQDFNYNLNEIKIKTRKFCLEKCTLDKSNPVF